MKMYYEFLIILNFLLDYMILYGTKRILKISKKNFRIFLGAIFGSLTTFIIFISISHFLLILIKFIFSLVMIIISFGIKDIIRKLLYFYMISISIGGAMYIFDFNTNYYLQMTTLLIISLSLIIILIKEVKYYRLILSNKYIVYIYYNNKEYTLEGFIDTGNRLISPYKNKTVILVNLNIKSNKYIYVPYKVLNGTGIIPCIKPDKVIINNKNFKNCLIGISKDKFSIDKLNCILPNKFKEELC